MKVFVALVLVVFSMILDGKAQESDGIYYSSEKPLSTDTIKSPIRKLGVYISSGLGFSGINSLPANVSELTIIGFIVSGSLAYKSHVASITYTTGGSTFTGAGERDSYFSNSYYAFLIGESLRYKHSFISLNVGIAHSELSFKNVIDRNKADPYDGVGLSFPVELKLYLLAKHGIGFGVHMYKNFDKHYSTSFIAASIVSGIWNK